MLRDYKDITEKLGVPQWWDDNGCPRYCAFRPDVCGVYDKVVALVEIACQDCGERFMVAVSYTGMDLYQREEWAKERGRSIYPSATDINAFHFGDPPPHDCVGDTMNCDTMRVVEFWRRQAAPMWGWERVSEYEIAYPQGQPWNAAHEEPESDDAVGQRADNPI